MPNQWSATWNKAEDRILRKLYSVHTVEYIAKQIKGKTPNQVSARAKRLKLKKHEAVNLTGWRRTYSEIVDLADRLYNEGVTIDPRDREVKPDVMEYALFRVYPHSLAKYQKQMGLSQVEVTELVAAENNQPFYLTDI